jgi:thiamine kinase-like enzyme
MCVLPLKPFIQEQEDMDKTSINNIIDMLVEHYLNSQLANRHSKAYKDMYKRLYETLEKINKEKEVSLFFIKDTSFYVLSY